MTKPSIDRAELIKACWKWSIDLQAVAETLHQAAEMLAADHVADVGKKVEALTQQKDAAYAERDRLVCALSKVFPSYLSRHAEDDVEWENDWRWIVTIDLPTGQASWHIHDSEREWFAHLEARPNAWDGHSTEEKYRRVAVLKAGNKPDASDHLGGADKMVEAPKVEPIGQTIERLVEQREDHNRLLRAVQTAHNLAAAALGNAKKASDG